MHLISGLFDFDFCFGYEAENFFTNLAKAETTAEIIRWLKVCLYFTLCLRFFFSLLFFFKPLK